MTQLVENIVIGLSTGVAAGLVTGFYSGLVISRLIRFNSLCSEALRHINSVEYMAERSRVRVDRNDVPKVPAVASELMHYGHRKAGKVLLDQHRAVADAIFAAEQGGIDTEQLSAVLSASYDKVRSASPNPKLFLPWGRS